MTVMLAIAGLLAGVLATSAGDLLDRSREVRAQQDVERVGRAVASFYADNGFFPKTDDTRAGRPGVVDLGALVSEAALPGVTESTVTWTQTRVGSLFEHLGRNGRGYMTRDRVGALGWAGPYLNGALGNDPWGAAYLVNVFWLDPRDIAREIDGTPLGAVYALSAGPNGVIETPYFQPREDARLWGDDIGFRLQ